MRRPDHRAIEAREVAEQRAATSDASVSALAALLQGQPCPLVAVEYAHDLWTVSEHRAAMDAFLLAKTPYPKITQVLGVDTDTVVAYAYLFMDVTVFRNKLELRSYAMVYGVDRYSAELVRTAVIAGPEYLLWTFDESYEGLEPRAVVRRAMVDGYFRGMAHRGNAITTDVAREAHRWMQQSVANAQHLEKLDPRTAQSAHDELTIAIKGRELTVSVDTAPVPPEDVLR